MKRVLYLYNPYAGHGAGAQMLDDVFSACLKQDIRVVAHRLFTMQPDLALEDCFQNASTHFDAILIAGGDGTLWQMLQVVMRHACHLPLGLLPMGTCNDTVRSLGLPDDFHKCLEYYISCLCADQSFRIDLGKITSVSEGENAPVYFLNSVAGGIFVDVSHKTKPELKKVFGPLAYYFSALGELTDMRPFSLEIETEEGVYRESALLFLLLNGTDVAGLTDVIGSADMRDGYMDILVVRAGKLWESLQAGLQIIRVLKNAKTILQIRCRRCTIQAAPAPIVSIDGEKGNPLPYTVEMLPQGLHLIGKESEKVTDLKGKANRPQSMQRTDTIAQTFAEYLTKAWTATAPKQNADGTYTAST